MLQRCGCSGSAGQAQTLSSPQRPTVTWVGTAAQCVGGSPPSSGFQLPLPPPRSELSMVRSRCIGVPHLRQSMGWGSVACQEAKPPARQPGGMDRSY